MGKNSQQHPLLANVFAHLHIVKVFSSVILRSSFFAYLHIVSRVEGGVVGHEIPEVIGKEEGHCLQGQHDRHPTIVRDMVTTVMTAMTSTVRDGVYRQLIRWDTVTYS